MIRGSFASLVLPVFLAAGALTAQPPPCAAFGNACPGGMGISCNAPQVGMQWVLGERNAQACGNPTQVLTMLGGCLSPGVSLGQPLLCAACSPCDWVTLPPYGTFQWTWPPRTTTIQVPSDPTLAGVTFCMQDICVNLTSACVCMSGAVQTTIQP
jgi:hypothetical protein